MLVPIEPDLIFKRISFIKKTQEELKEFLKYELSPYPLSLFDQTGMRKSKKSILYDMFTPVSEESINDGTRAYVIDGGYLLHKVVWQKGSTFGNICKKYVNYINTHYINATVVFDGYDNEFNVKNQERKRRAAKGKLGPEVVILNSQTEATVTQESFLSNEKNKSRFISLLTPYLQAEGISVYQSCDDADTLIVTKPATISQTNRFDHVIIVGEDVDLLAILTSINCSNLYMIKPGKGRVCTKFYNSKSFTGDPQSILFCHAFTGCDSTSAIYKQGKKRACNLITKKNALKSFISIFNDAQATPDEIASAGEIFFCHLYGKETVELNSLRYEKFSQLITKNKLDLASLPPSKSAARTHSLRAYYQIQKWRSNDIDPTCWGWERNRSFLSPILTLDKPAPDEIMKMISCKCKSTCKGNCTCTKSGLPCTELCVFCTDKPCNGDKNISEGAAYDERFEMEINNLEREDILDKSKEHESEDEIEPILTSNIANFPTTSTSNNPDIYEWLDMDFNNSSDSEQQVKKQKLSIN